LGYDEALAEISGVQGRGNRVAAAVAPTREMALPGARCCALLNIADILVRDGDRGRTAEVVASIGDGSGRARALLKVARF
jgi:hypothetical protein